MKYRNAIWLSITEPCADKIIKIKDKGFYLLIDKKLNSKLLNKDIVDEIILEVLYLLKNYETDTIFIDVNDYKHISHIIKKIENKTTVYIT